MKDCDKRLLKAALVLCLFTTTAGLQAQDGKTFVLKDVAVAEAQYKEMLASSSDLSRFPRTTAEDGTRKYTGVSDWTGGFFPGGLWYLYEITGSAEWKYAARRWTEALAKGQYNTAHHDVGFVMYCSYGNAYRLTKDPEYKKVLLQSAESLSSRFDPKVGSIKSWNSRKSWNGVLWQYPVIIDNMMNLELLFFASKVSADPKYRNIAVSHALNAMRDHIRPDYSSYHVVNYDAATGKVLNRQTCQGYSDNSTWARGQAWGIYGFTMVYRETHDRRFLETARKMADFYLNNSRLPEDKVPYWDFNVNQKGYVPDWKYDLSKFSYIPRDASAAAVVSSALFELSGCLGKEGKKYYQAALDMLKSLSGETYLAEPGANNNFLLKHSTGSIPHGFEIDVPLIYADYYFLEALQRYKKINNL